MYVSSSGWPWCDILPWLPWSFDDWMLRDSVMLLHTHSILDKENLWTRKFSSSLIDILHIYKTHTILNIIYICVIPPKTHIFVTSDLVTCKISICSGSEVGHTWAWPNISICTKSELGHVHLPCTRTSLRMHLGAIIHCVGTKKKNGFPTLPCLFSNPTPSLSKYLLSGSSSFSNSFGWVCFLTFSCWFPFHVWIFDTTGHQIHTVCSNTFFFWCHCFALSFASLLFSGLCSFHSSLFCW